MERCGKDVIQPGGRGCHGMSWWLRRGWLARASGVTKFDESYEDQGNPETTRERVPRITK